jgi:hypothetical protein
MGSFRHFLEQQQVVEFVQEAFDAPSEGPIHPTVGVPVKQHAAGKPWSATKDEIMAMWRNLRYMPIRITPMDKDRDSDTYGEDGIRITGTFPFISSVIARLKDMLSLENPHTKLRLVFRGIDKSRDARPDRQSYVFYVNLERRSHGRPGRPRKGPEIPGKVT